MAPSDFDLQQLGLYFAGPVPVVPARVDKKVQGEDHRHGHRHNDARQHRGRAAGLVSRWGRHLDGTDAVYGNMAVRALFNTRIMEKSVLDIQTRADTVLKRLVPLHRHKGVFASVHAHLPRVYDRAFLAHRPTLAVLQERRFWLPARVLHGTGLNRRVGWLPSQRSLTPRG